MFSCVCMHMQVCVCIYVCIITHNLHLPCSKCNYSYANNLKTSRKCHSQLRAYTSGFRGNPAIGMKDKWIQNHDDSDHVYTFLETTMTIYLPFACLHLYAFWNIQGGDLAYKCSHTHFDKKSTFLHNGPDKI